MSYWGSVGIDHNARNVARYWIATEDLTIASSGEAQTFSGTFEIDTDASHTVVSPEVYQKPI